MTTARIWSLSVLMTAVGYFAEGAYAQPPGGIPPSPPPRNEGPPRGFGENPPGVRLTPQQQAQLQAQSQQLPLTAQQQAQLQAQAQPASQPLPPQQQPPAAPFQLTPQQQAETDSLLKAWEQKQVKQLSATFTRWTYNTQFGQKEKEGLSEEASGEVKYLAPDKGLFRVNKSRAYNMTKNTFDDAPDRAEEWRSDGKSIYEFDHRNKHLVEHRLPPQLQGKAIVDTPLPFVFGAEAEKIKDRYWVRIVTPPNQPGRVWLEAFPRWQKDAANFQRVEIILNDKDLVPVALRLHLPGGQSHHAYMFTPVKEIWNPFAPGFESPRAPFGWKKVVDDPSQPAIETPGGAPPAFNDPSRQAKQPPATNALPKK